MNRLLLIGLNHTTAPLEVRERLSFNAQQRADAIERFKQQFPACELVLLSTCNRVEFYLAVRCMGTHALRSCFSSSPISTHFRRQRSKRISIKNLIAR